MHNCHQHEQAERPVEKLYLRYPVNTRVKSLNLSRTTGTSCRINRPATSGNLDELIRIVAHAATDVSQQDSRSVIFFCIETLEKTFLGRKECLVTPWRTPREVTSHVIVEHLRPARGVVL